MEDPTGSLTREILFNHTKNTFEVGAQAIMSDLGALGDFLIEIPQMILLICLLRVYWSITPSILLMFQPLNIHV